jgi:tetratricopeptide (TPR) repeat protein
MRVVPFVAALSLVVALPADAQLRAARPPRPVQNNPRLMVANPHSFAAADSAASVRVGAGLRERLVAVAEKWFTVIERSQMNDALVQYGYPPDAVLPPLVARQLGTQLQARAMLTGTLTRVEGGRAAVEARLLGISDNTGYMIRMTQEPNQSFEDLGKAMADGLKGAFAALQEAKECLTQTTASNPAKAAEAAQKALRLQPNHGLASVCLAQLAVARSAPATEVITHYENAVKGDRLSLEAWGGLLGKYQEKGDTARIIETYKEILRVAPTNQQVREAALKWLVAANHPQVGEEVAREGLALDAANPDLWDLLSTACLVQQTPEKNKCALEALEQVVALDTAKADTTLYQKALFVAAQDTTQPAPYIKWASAARKKYPGNPYFLAELVRAYGYAGEVDNLVAATKELVAVDTSDMQPVLRAVIALNGAKRFTEAIDLGRYIERFGQDTDKRNLGSILAQGGLAVLQAQPIDFKLAEAIGRKSVGFLGTTGRAAQLANYVLGIGLMGQIAEKDQAVRDSKACEPIDALEKIIAETKAAFVAGREIQPAFIDERIPLLDKYAPTIAQMRKAYCKAK